MSTWNRYHIARRTTNKPFVQRPATGSLRVEDETFFSEGQPFESWGIQIFILSSLLRLFPNIISHLTLIQLTRNHRGPKLDDRWVVGRSSHEEIFKQYFAHRRDLADLEKCDWNVEIFTVIGRPINRFSLWGNNKHLDSLSTKSISLLRECALTRFGLILNIDGLSQVISLMYIKHIVATYVLKNWIYHACVKDISGW